MEIFSTGDKQNMIVIANEFTRIAVNMESIRNREKWMTRVHNWISNYKEFQDYLLKCEDNLTYDFYMSVIHKMRYMKIKYVDDIGCGNYPFQWILFKLYHIRYLGITDIPEFSDALPLEMVCCESDVNFSSKGFGGNEKYKSFGIPTGAIIQKYQNYIFSTDKNNEYVENIVNELAKNYQVLFIGDNVYTSEIAMKFHDTLLSDYYSHSYGSSADHLVLLERRNLNDIV